MKRSKKYKAAAEKIKIDNLYLPGEAMKLVKETSTVKYDATVDIALFLGVDPKKADQAIRSTVNLPHGTGKTARVLVFAGGERAEEARAAGADIVGADELIDEVSKGRLDYDAVVSTPELMGDFSHLMPDYRSNKSLKDFQENLSLVSQEIKRRNSRKI